MFSLFIASGEAENIENKEAIEAVNIEAHFSKCDHILFHFFTSYISYVRILYLIPPNI